MKVDFIFCTESGYLEPMAKLLAFSIRNFGGQFSQSKIFSYSPRKSKRIHSSTVEVFEELQVDYVDEELNKDYKFYPIANKILSCAHRENNTDSDVLVFLDTDTLFLDPPEILNKVSPGEVYARPVDFKGIGTDRNYSGVNGEYWKKMFQILGLQDRGRYVNTTMDDQEIIEYYNAGLVITHRSNGFFTEWKKHFEKVMQADLKHKRKRIRNTDQATITASLISRDLDAISLDKRYNCPFHVQHKCKNEAYKVEKISELIHLHYHYVFSNRTGSNPLYDHLQGFEAGATINTKLLEYGVQRKMSSGEILEADFRSMINRVKRSIKFA